MLFAAQFSKEKSGIAMEPKNHDFIIFWAAQTCHSLGWFEAFKRKFTGNPYI